MSKIVATASNKTLPHENEYEDYREEVNKLESMTKEQLQARLVELENNPVLSLSEEEINGDMELVISIDNIKQEIDEIKELLKKTNSKFNFEKLDEHGVNLYVINSDKVEPKDSDEAIKSLFSKLFEEKPVQDMLNEIEADDLISVNDVDFSGKDLIDYVDVALSDTVEAETTRCDKCHEQMDTKDGVEAMGRDLELVCEPCADHLERCPKCDRVGKPEESFSYGQETCDNCLDKAADMSEGSNEEVQYDPNKKFKNLKEKEDYFHALAPNEIGWSDFKKHHRGAYNQLIEIAKELVSADRMTVKEFEATIGKGIL